MGLTRIVEDFVFMTHYDYIGGAKSLVIIHSLLLALIVLFIILPRVIFLI
jgi:hypothetical protein